MSRFPKEYIKLLSEKYPNEAAVCAELINLGSVLALPKGTEHFISDLHGEYEAVRHILNNCSGVILEKVRKLFIDELGESGCHQLCSIIYYPTEKLAALSAAGLLSDEFLRDTIMQMRALAETLSSKYTRSYVRKLMPRDLEFVLDELLHIQADEDKNQHRYHSRIVDSIFLTGTAHTVISALADLIKSLAVDRLHVVGDIFDRGPKPAAIVEMLMDKQNLDIQWGNHDILWLGAAAGSAACISTVIRISIDYGNEAVLERSYGISMRHLTEFCENVYGSSSLAMQKLAISVLGFKLEGNVIMRNPDFEMSDRLMLDRVNWKDNTIVLGGNVHSLNSCFFPTIDPCDPYRLSIEEEKLTEQYIFEFKESGALRRHMNFIYKKGSTYLCCNGNLLYHGCIPLNPDGSFSYLKHEGKKYSGKALMDFADSVVRSAWNLGEESFLDLMWYLWCGKNSPFSGRSFHTFERAVIDDRSTWVEPKNPYFDYWEDSEVISDILVEFGLCPEEGHIINGHTPVKAKKGESPVKAGGKLFIIDGGFCKAYQSTTGIAGYTLIYSSHGLRLKSHRPFEGVTKVLSDNVDMESESVPVLSFSNRRYIADTDKAAGLNERISALKYLLGKYRLGELAES